MSVKPKELLRTGHIVTYRNGSLRRVFLDTGMHEPNVLVGDEVWNSLANYNDELLYNSGSGNADFDIMKIVTGTSILNLVDTDLDSITTTTIWKRSEPKEMTIAEIEQALGYPVKIVKEKAAK